MTRSPVEERPRERLLRLGAANLRTAELLAILVRTGRKGITTLQAGERIATEFNDKLDQLKDAGRGELARLCPVVRDTAYCQIMAGIELGRHVAAAAADQTDRRGQYSRLAGCHHLLPQSFRPAGHRRPTGGISRRHAGHEESRPERSPGQPRVVGSNRRSSAEVFRPAIQDAAKSVILVHNHPSGDATPSDKDFALTRRLEDAGKLLDIQVLDHIVVARAEATSIREYQGLGLES